MKTTRPDSRDALLEAGLVLSSALSLPTVLRRIVEVACDLTQARYGALGVLGPQGTVVDFITHGISDDVRIQIGRPPSGRGILGVLIADARPLRLADISRDPRAVGFPPHHPPMTSFLGAPVMARGRVFGNIYLTDKRGADQFSDEDERALVVLAIQAGAAVANASLYREAVGRERWLGAAHEITTAIIGGAQLQDVLEIVAGRARELLHADVAVIAVPAGDDPLTFAIEVVDGRDAQALRGVTLPVDGTAVGEAIRTGHPVVLAVPAVGRRRGPALARLARAGPAIFVPLSVRDRAIGVLGVGSAPGRSAFDEEEVRMVGSFATQAAMALEYARAQAELRRLALLDDRERIAKDLHDGVIQSLFAVGMGLQVAATLAGPSEIEHRIEAAVGELDRVIRDLRNYIFGLRPGLLAENRLDEALRLLAGEFGDRCGVTTVVQIAPEVAARLSDRAVDLVQLTREALSNVGRHAQASTCRVSLQLVRGRAVLQVEDDGHGFDPRAVSPPSQGLRNMRERVAALGGRVEIRSRPASGTSLRVILPLA